MGLGIVDPTTPASKNHRNSCTTIRLGKNKEHQTGRTRRFNVR